MNNLMTNSGKRAIRATQILQCKKECDERGITVSQWCREHNLSEKSYCTITRSLEMRCTK